VLAFFGEGRELEGRWGWLETLRQAELGDELRFYENAPDVWPSSGPAVFWGTLAEHDGKLYIQSEDGLIEASEAAALGDAYSVWRSIGTDVPLVPHAGPFHAHAIYTRLRYRPSQVDWQGVALDVIGIATALAEVKAPLVAGGDRTRSWSQICQPDTAPGPNWGGESIRCEPSLGRPCTRIWSCA